MGAALLPQLEPCRFFWIRHGMTTNRRSARRGVRSTSRRAIHLVSLCLTTTILAIFVTDVAFGDDDVEITNNSSTTPFFPQPTPLTSVPQPNSASELSHDLLTDDWFEDETLSESGMVQNGIESRCAKHPAGRSGNDSRPLFELRPETQSRSNSIRLTSQKSTASEDSMSFEDRLRMLEEQLEFQKQENELFRERLAEIGKDKTDKPNDDQKKEEKKEDKSFKGGWKHQLTFESPDKNFVVHLGGRTQIDTVWLHHNPAAFGVGNNSGSDDAVNLRRARLRADGTIFKTIDYAVEYDFANGLNDNPDTPSTSANVINVPVPTDGHWTFREIPVFSNIRVGLQKEPIGFEHLTSSRYLDFLERSFNQDAYTGTFNNGFTPGVSTFQNYGEDDRGFVQFGLFKNSVNPFAYSVDDGGYAVDGRVTYLLLDEDDGEQLIHIGGAYSFRDPIKDGLRIRSRGSLRNGPGPLNPVFADSGAL
ncbi:MAG: hypothetical protein FJ267_07010, partial [Planctomycetes bacterium]|nr:hypothetical protein [Planctomycetota bacterium]